MGIGTLVSPLFLGLFDLYIKAGSVKLLAEVALVIILFVDALRGSIWHTTLRLP